ncbi:MAG TPA: META domain-containing protein [Polyangiales bacterium]|nr:META domain-containing protein [Polyangiales bacterium]
MRKTCLLCLALLACGDDESSGLELDERRFILQSGREAVAGTKPTLTFDEGELGYFGGCNAKGGPFSITGGKLLVKELTSDAAACEPAPSAQDEFFASFLISSPTFALDGATLTLTGGGATLVFVEAP